MHALPPILLLAGLLAMIWYLGSANFGRAQTQAWIDRVKSQPRLHAWLNRHHGKFRAAGHYVEFGGLFLVLYWLYDEVWAHASMRFDPVVALALAFICVVIAYIDEKHQLSSGARQFRRVDFLHSCCGITIAAAIVEYATVLRGI